MEVKIVVLQLKEYRQIDNLEMLDKLDLSLNKI